MQMTERRFNAGIWSLVVATVGLALSVLVGSARIAAAFANVSAEHQRILQILDRKCP